MNRPEGLLGALVTLVIVLIVAWALVQIVEALASAA